MNVVVLDSAPDMELLGARRAPLVHRLLREHTLAWARAAACDRVLLSGEQAPPGVELISSALDAPLGERVLAAAALALERTSEPLLLVGIRCWALSPAHARSALSDLIDGGCDLSVGPATAGGAYLIGVRELGPARVVADALSPGGLGERGRAVDRAAALRARADERGCRAGAAMRPADVCRVDQRSAALEFGDD